MLFDMIGGLGHMLSQGAAAGMRAVANALSPAKPDPTPQSIGAIQGAMARDTRQASKPAGAQASAFSLKDVVTAAIDTNRDGKLSQAEAAAFLADVLGMPARPTAPMRPSPSAGVPVRPPAEPSRSSHVIPAVEFARVDRNKDGRVTGAEVCADAIRETMDADRDGVVSKKEYLNGTRGNERVTRDVDFDRMDLNSDGKLDEGELVRGVRPTAADEALAERLNATNLARFDANADGIADGKEVAVRRLLDLGDRDGDRRMTFDELEALRPKFASHGGVGPLDIAMHGVMELERLKAAKARFKELDRDGDGKLNEQELRGYVKPTQADYQKAADLSQ